MGCCCNRTEDRDHPETRIGALRRTIDQAQRELAEFEHDELEHNQEEAA